jgi:hypothetical protein
VDGVILPYGANRARIMYCSLGLPIYPFPSNELLFTPGHQSSRYTSVLGGVAMTHTTQALYHTSRRDHPTLERQILPSLRLVRDGTNHMMSQRDKAEAGTDMDEVL